MWLCNGHSYLRNSDTGFKILKTVAQRLVDNAGVEGVINLISELNICPGCTLIFSIRDNVGVSENRLDCSRIEYLNIAFNKE